MILLKQLTIKDFLSHHDTTIHFDKDVKLLLDGKSGSGKSTVVDSLLWCLFGKGRSENRSLVRKGTKIATVSLHLTDDSILYIITRSITSLGKTTLTVTKSVSGSSFVSLERTGKKDLDDWIQNTLLHSSYELFVNSIVYVQNGEESFVKATATKRKDLLLEIVGAKGFDELYVKSRDAITKVESEVSVINAKVDGYEKTIQENVMLENRLELYEKDVASITQTIETKTKEQRELENSIKDTNSITQQLKDKKVLETRLSNVIKALGSQILLDVTKTEEFEKIDIETARNKVETLKKLNTDIEEEEKNIRKNNELQSAINAHLANKPAVFDYSKDIERINKQLIPLIKDSGSCPAGEDCPFVIPIKGQIAFLEEQIQDKEEKTKISQSLLTSWSNEYAALPKPSDSTELYTRIESLKKDVKTLSPYLDVAFRYEMDKERNKELNVKIQDNRNQLISDTIEWNALKEEIETLEREILKVNPYIQSQVNELIADIQTLNKNKEEAVRNHILAQQAQKVSAQARQSLAVLSGETKTLKSQYDDLLLLKEALSPKGIKAVIIDYLVPTLETRINDILSQMSDFRIRLDTQQEKVEEGIKEGLFLTVKNGEGQELPFSNLSGGEGVKVSMAISEALASLMSSVGFRLLDECINALDIESIQSFTEVVLRLQEKFPQLLMISHIQDIKDLFEERVIITKINGVSQIN